MAGLTQIICYHKGSKLWGLFISRIEQLHAMSSLAATIVHWNWREKVAPRIENSDSTPCKLDSFRYFGKWARSFSSIDTRMVVLGLVGLFGIVWLMKSEAEPIDLWELTKPVPHGMTGGFRHIYFIPSVIAAESTKPERR